MSDFGIRDIGDCIGNDYISTEMIKYNIIAAVSYQQVNSPHHLQKPSSQQFLNN